MNLTDFKNKTVYIVGSMTKEHNYNFHKFNAVTEYLRKHDITVINPADIGLGYTWKEYMRIAMFHATIADCLLAIPNWEKSRGVKFEYYVCHKYGSGKFFTLSENFIEKCLNTA